MTTSRSGCPIDPARIAAPIVALIVAATAGCERAATPIVPPPPNVASYVTDDVARSLDANGRFVLRPPQAPDGSLIISEMRARQLAAAYVRTFGVFHVQTWERHRGGKISLAHLEVSPRVYFAQTPYAAVPPGLHPSAKKSFGPYYLVPLEENGSLAVLLAVSAHNTDTEIGTDGQLILPRLDGNGFIGTGIPANDPAHAAISPEEAVEQVARAAKKKVALVPELVLPGVRVMPVFALWQVTLESDVAVSRQGERDHDQARAIYFGSARANDMRVPTRSQRTEDTRTTVSVDAQGRVGPDVTFRVPVRAGQSVEFQAVTVHPEPAAAPAVTGKRRYRDIGRDGP